MNQTNHLVSRIAEEIVKQVKSYEIGEPVYSVIVCYSTEADAFPPWVAVGTERERARMGAEDLDREGLYALLWSGEELERYDPVEVLESDGSFMDRYAEWVNAGNEDDLFPERISALALRICFALQKVDWASVFPVTEDFTVMANDQKCQWLETNASVLLDEKQRKKWVEKGWLMG